MHRLAFAQSQPGNGEKCYSSTVRPGRAFRDPGSGLCCCGEGGAVTQKESQKCLIKVTFKTFTSPETFEHFPSTKLYYNMLISSVDLPYCSCIVIKKNIIVVI